MTEPLPIEVEALALKALEARVKDGLNLSKACITGYSPGDKHTFRSPISDRKLGMVYVTDPDATWQVTDRDALDAWLRADPAALEETVEIDDMPAALEALQDHAPHVLAFVSRVSEAARRSAVELAKAGGQVPGVERVKPSGSLVVRPDKAAADVIAELVAADLLTWDGRRVLPAGGQEASA